MSRANEPVDTTGTCLGVTDRPSHIIDPFPNEAVIWSKASCSAVSFFDNPSSLESLPSDLDFFRPSPANQELSFSSYIEGKASPLLKDFMHYRYSCSLNKRKDNNRRFHII